MFYLASFLFILFGWISCASNPAFYAYQLLKFLLGCAYAWTLTYLGLVDHTFTAFVSHYLWAIAVAWIFDYFILKALSDDEHLNIIQILGATVAVFATLYFIIIYPFSITKDEYHVVKGKQVEQLQQETDEKNIPSVPYKYAKYMADKLFGEIDNSSFYNLGEYTVQKLGNTLYWVVPVEFEDYSTYGKSKKIVPGYIKVNALDENADAEFVPVKMKYVPSAYFGNNLQRIVRNKYKDVIIMEASFEPDDEGKPYYAVTVGKYSKFRHVPEVEGIVLFNPENGNMKYYSKEKTPKFIDQLIPASEIAEPYNEWYGAYAKGWVNSWWGKEGIKVPTKWSDGQEVAPVFDKNGNMSWFTDFTSPSGGKSIVGYSLMNARTGEFTYYTGEHAKGLLNGEAAISAVTKSYKKDEFKATSPMLYNIYGEMTWFVSVVDGDGLLRAYALVNGKDAKVLGTAPTKKEAFARYQTAIALKKAGGKVVPGKLIGTDNFEGIVDSKEVVAIDKEVFMFYTLQGKDKVFKVSMSKLPLAMRIKENQKVKFSTFDTEEEIVEVQAFEVLNQ